MVLFQPEERFYVAYADCEGNNEFLIRDGSKYAILTNGGYLFSIPAIYAVRTLQLIDEQILTFRGKGYFKNKLKTEKKGAIK